jgi:hypothetical protein
MLAFKGRLENLFCQTYTGSYAIKRRTQIFKILNSSCSSFFYQSKLNPAFRFGIVILADILIGVLLTNLLKEDLFSSDKLASNALYFADLVVYWLQR